MIPTLRTNLSLVLVLFATAAPLHQAFAAEPQRYALVIGVEDYHHQALRGANQIRYAVEDAVDLAAQLRQADYQVELLTEADATKARIEAAVRKLRAQARDRADTVMVVLAGHGLQVAGEKQAYFCPVDGVPLTGEYNTLVSVHAFLYPELEKSLAGTKLILVDACRNDPDSTRGISRGFVPGAVGPPPQGIAVIYSCSAGQRAWEDPDVGHGVFFQHVLEAMNGAGGEALSMYLLLHRVTEPVTAHARRINGGVEQTPQVEWLGSGSPLILPQSAQATGLRKKMTAPEIARRTSEARKFLTLVQAEFASRDREPKLWNPPDDSSEYFTRKDALIMMAWDYALLGDASKVKEAIPALGLLEKTDGNETRPFNHATLARVLGLCLKRNPNSQLGEQIASLRKAALASNDSGRLLDQVNRSLALADRFEVPKSVEVQLFELDEAIEKQDEWAALCILVGDPRILATLSTPKMQARVAKLKTSFPEEAGESSQENHSTRTVLASLATDLPKLKVLLKETTDERAMSHQPWWVLPLVARRDFSIQLESLISMESGGYSGAARWFAVEGLIDSGDLKQAGALSDGLIGRTDFDRAVPEYSRLYPLFEESYGCSMAGNGLLVCRSFGRLEKYNAFEQHVRAAKLQRLESLLCYVDGLLADVSE